MSFIVIGAPLSPFVRKVHITMQLKGIKFEMDPVSPFELPQDYQKINPLKRIPVLKHDDQNICDSAVICRYLDDIHPEVRLIPTDPSLRAQTGWLEKFADYELAPAVSFTAFRHRVIYRSVGAPFDEAAIDTLIAEKTPPLYEYLNQQIGDNDFLVGTKLSLADIAVVAQFINASLGDEHPDEARWPNLAHYLSSHFASSVFAPTIASARKTVFKMLAKAPG